MNVINLTVHQSHVTVPLGLRGENGVREVRFDYSAWVSAFGPGVCTLLVKRSKDANAYPVALAYDGNIAIWTVSATDTQYNGIGKAEFAYTVNSQIAKSIVFGTSVQPDIGEPSVTPPDPYESWLDTLTELEAATLQNAQDAAQSASDAAGSSVDAQTAQTAAETAQEAAEAAAAHLVIDPTFSVSGAAADAKAVGDAVDELKNAISELDEDVYSESTERVTDDISSDITWSVGFVNLSGTVNTTSPTYHRSQKLAVSEGDSLTFGGSTRARYVTAYSGSSAVSASGKEYVFSFTVPSGIDGVIISFTPTTAPSYVKWTHNVAVKTSRIETLETQMVTKASEDYVDKKTTAVSENVFDYASRSANTIVTKAGAVQTNADYAATDYIAVSENDVIVGSASSTGTALYFRVVTAYDSSKTVISASGAENVSSYTVPSGVAFVRISLYTNQVKAISTIYLDGIRHGYLKYYNGEDTKLSSQNYSRVDRLYDFTLTSLPEYILSNLAYKPIGPLSKGYVCLVSYDGDADLATYTIPMLEEKEVPGTFAVMSTSEVFETQSGIDAVVDAVENNGCCIAQHGGTNWTASAYDEYIFTRFLDAEAAFFTELGLTPYGAVCPSHEISKLISAIFGGRFGCVRTGYGKGKPFYHPTSDASFANGPRSNLYGLTSQSALDNLVWTDVLDAVKTNHYLQIIHWHEAEMDATDKAQLESIIDYAKSIGLTFVTMKDIPTIV